MKIALVGATGFIGQTLVPRLIAADQIPVLFVRNPDKARRCFPAARFPQVEIVSDSDVWPQALGTCQGAVNLAGEPISARWTAEYKERILASRRDTTRRLVEAMTQANPKPRVFISASAVGYYGASETARFDETSAPGEDFLAQVCQVWEKEALVAETFGTRVALLRLGIVLGCGGGALAKILPPFQLFAGGPLGTGKQWFSWIDIEDVAGLILWILQTETVTGAVNATAPNPVRMAEFCQTLGDVLNRPAWLPAPSFALKLLLGEGAQLVLEGQQVLPQAALNQGYEFRYPQLRESLLKNTRG
ncbi:MAG: TIGR01777 family protein [Cyanobacteria bacterium RI_101]|nr:TIGR01777 family protein [Cyanobacteria bacterium RI_101]